MNPQSIRQWLLVSIKQYRNAIASVLAVSMVIVAVDIAFPLIWQRLIDQAGTGRFETQLAIIVVGIFVIQAMPVPSLIRERLMNRHRNNARYEIFRHLLGLSIPFFQAQRSTVLVEKSSKGVESGTKLLRALLNGHILADIPVALFAIWYVHTQSDLALLGLLGFGVCFVLVFRAVGRRYMEARDEAEVLDNDLKRWWREVFAQMMVVKLHRAEEQELAEIKRRGDQILALENRQDLFDGILMILSQGAALLPELLALLLFLPRVADHTLSLGTMFAMVAYASKVVTPMGYLGAVYQEMMQFRVRLRPMLDLLAEVPSVLEAENPIDAERLHEGLRLCDVSFTYPGASVPAVDHVSFMIPVGQKIAIVGKSGSGKSTLARLLARFYDPDTGEISLDELNLKLVSFRSLYTLVRYMTQEVPMRSTTVADNILYGVEAEHHHLLEEVCRRAAADFVFTLPKGLDTDVGELAGNLSGGQLQRLAIARILIGELPSLIILDEATKGLDEPTAKAIRAAFDELMRVHAVSLVVIDHDMAAVRDADQIIVMRKGRIVDIGTHPELTNRCPLYADLCREPSKEE